MGVVFVPHLAGDGADEVTDRGAGLHRISSRKLHSCGRLLDHTHTLSVSARSSEALPPSLPPSITCKRETSSSEVKESKPRSTSDDEANTSSSVPPNDLTRLITTAGT